MSFRDICCEGPSVSGNLTDRRSEKTSRRKSRSKGKRSNDSPDWDYYNERRNEYEQTMASYSDSQSSEADQEYSRSPTWSWDYGDEEDEDHLDYYPNDYEGEYRRPDSRSLTPHLAPVSQNVYSDFNRRRSEKVKNNDPVTSSEDTENINLIM